MLPGLERELPPGELDDMHNLVFVTYKKKIRN